VVDEDHMIQNLLKEKAAEVQQWAAEANASAQARAQQQLSKSKKRGYFDIANNLMPSGHRSEADMSQYFHSAAEFNVGPQPPQVPAHQPDMPEEQPYQYPGQIDEEEFSECH